MPVTARPLVDPGPSVHRPVFLAFADQACQGVGAFQGTVTLSYAHCRHVGGLRLGRLA